MSGRILLAAATAVAVAAGLVGCGIPDQTGVRVDGGGPARGAGINESQRRQPPVRADSGGDPAQFVLNFLQAAAGESGGAYQRVREYVAKNSRLKVPDQQGQELAINVVRLLEPPSPTNNGEVVSVTVSVQHVGVLRANGSIEPPVERETSYSFKLTRTDSTDAGRADQESGYYLLDPPPVLLMSTEALDAFYLQRTIYFWSKDGRSLVPDVRYLPMAVPAEGQATEMLGWLVGGPADWLKSTASGLPPGTKTIGNVFPQGGKRLVVNLAVDSALKDGDLQQLGTQLVWSLLETLPRGDELELTVKDQGSRVFDVGAERQAHPVYRIDRTPPERFCVYNGAVRRLLDPGQAPGDPVPIAPEANRNVVAAAFSQEEPGDLWAALVTAASGGRRLLVGSGADTASRFVHGGRVFAQMSRPIWLRNLDPSHPVGLVVADGGLFRFGANGALDEVDLPGAVGAVTAVAAGLDGRRIAFVAGGRLYVAALTTAGTSATVGSARQLPTSLRSLTAVEWTAENKLVVAGLKANQRTALYEISVDGAVEVSTVDDLGAAKVSHIAAYPANPVRAGGGRPMYVANGVAWDGSQRFQVDADQVDLPSPVPGGASKPTAPFFLY